MITKKVDENGDVGTALDLGSKNLKKLPSFICHFTRLEKLLLPSNALTALPREIGNLTNIQGPYFIQSVQNVYFHEVHNGKDLPTLHTLACVSTDFRAWVNNTFFPERGITQNVAPLLPLNVFEALYKVSPLHLFKVQLT